jgi:IS5 family transposase
MNQQTLAMAADQNAQYEQHGKPIKCDTFLATMERIVPWAAMCAVIEPHYPKAGNGRPPVGLERMLRMYFVQLWFNLAGAACKDALLDSTALRRHRSGPLEGARRDDSFGVPPPAGEAQAGRGSVRQGWRGSAGPRAKVGTGTIVDATIIGADSKTGLAHSAAVTAANVHDKHPLPQLMHGQEEQLYGDSTYASQQELISSEAPKAADLTNQRVRKGSATEEFERLINPDKSRVRAHLEHVFGIIKRLRGFDKVRYRGLAKNATRSFVALGLTNIYLARGVLYGGLKSQVQHPLA